MARKAQFTLKKTITQSTFSFRLMVGCFLLGSVGFVVSQTGVMVNHPQTRSIHSLLHLIGSGGGSLWLLGLVIYALANAAELRLFGLLALGLVGLGLLAFIVGNFNYAFIHGLLNLVTINDPIHQVPLNVAPLVLSAGTLLFGLSAARNKNFAFYLVLFFLLSSIIYAYGWLEVGDSMQRQRNLSRYLKALLIVLPFGLAWFTFGVELLRRRLDRSV